MSRITLPDFHIFKAKILCNVFGASAEKLNILYTVNAFLPCKCCIQVLKLVKVLTILWFLFVYSTSWLLVEILNFTHLSFCKKMKTDLSSYTCKISYRKYPTYHSGKNALCNDILTFPL